MVTYFFQDGPTSGDLGVENFWVYTPGGLSKTNKDLVYTPMGGSPKISVMVYSHYGGSPKHDRNTIR